MALMRFNKPTIYRKDLDSVLQTLVDEEIGPGERKREYEESYASLIGKNHGVAYRSFYDTLYASLKALNLEDNSYVGISVLSPKVYLDAIKRASLRPIILDVDDKMLLSVEDASKNLRDLKALIYYEPCSQIPRDAEPIKSLGLRIIEDISESVGSYWENEEEERIYSGIVGDIVVAKSEDDSIITTGGGGIALFDSDELYDRFTSVFSDISKYVGLSDINAALGIVQIQKLESILVRRESIYRRLLSAALRSNSKVFGSVSMDFHPNGSGFIVIVESKPEEIIEFSKKYQVVCKRSFTSSVGESRKSEYDRFPNAMGALNRALSFPIYPFLREGEMEALEKVLSHLH